MAVTTKTTAKFGFYDSLGGSLTKTFTDIDPAVQNSDLQALSAGIVANKEIYPVQPVTAKSIQLVSTTTTDIALS